MGLLSIFKRKTVADAGARSPGSSPSDVQKARARARQRLVGAAVLVLTGVVVFPLLFESRPRPIPVDIPIDIPRKEGAPPLVVPSPRPVPAAGDTTPAPLKPTAVEARVASGPTATAPTTSGASSPALSRPDEAAAPPPADSRATPAPADTPAKPATAVAATTPASTPAATPAPTPAPAPAVRAESARAKALLEGKPAVGKEGRFVVQVGAFAESSAAQETRNKVEKLGLKTFTQVVETASGSRIRVRLGPFSTREEAERVLAKAKSAGVNGVVLTL